MTVANPWVLPPWSDKELPREQLENRIEQLLSMENTCVLATVSKGGKPVASPIEFYSDGLDLYMLPDPGTPKLLAMERDSYVSLAVHRNFCNWVNARGAQYFGHAEIIEPHAPGWEHGMNCFRWRMWAEDMGWDLDEPPPRTVAKIVPDRILYTETWLWKEGYSARQVWRREA